MFKPILIAIIFTCICLSYYFWISPLFKLIYFFSFGIYVLIIAPLVYWKWIIPGIQQRHGRKLIFNWVHRFDSHPSVNKALDLASYITYAYCGYRLKGRYFDTLDKFNYDVKTASKLEIIISITTTIGWYFLAVLLGCELILNLYDWLLTKI